MIQNGIQNHDKIEKYLEKCRPKSIQKNTTFQKVPKIRKMNPRCDFVSNKGERVSTEWSVFGSQGPQESGPKYTHAS